MNDGDDDGSPLRASGLGIRSVPLVELASVSEEPGTTT